MIDEKTFLEFIQYWRDLATSHVDIMDFAHGGTREINQISKSDLDYPCLWLETPSLLPKDNNLGNARLQWRTGVAIITSSSKINEALDTQANPNLARDTLYNSTYLIALDIMRKIKKDYREAKLELRINTVSLDPIDQLFVDNVIGWRLEVSMDFNFNLAYNPAKFV